METDPAHHSGGQAETLEETVIHERKTTDHVFHESALAQ